jgi:regulator of RNase E activity RraA
VSLTYQIKEIQSAEVRIRPNDLIMGDADGVVAIPPEVAEECVKLCQSRWEIDEKTREALENGDMIGPTIQRLRK